MLDVKFLMAEIKDQFVFDTNPRPWIIGFSGGKDSTMLLQLVWYAIAQLDQEARNSRKVYIVCNNTLVENPKVLKGIEATLHFIEKVAQANDMPFTVHRTTPKLGESFWVKLIGSGYRAPDKFFRWCTERLKINPTSDFIKSRVSENGEVVVLLGTREAESTNRANSMRKHELFGQRLRKGVLPNSYVYAPLKDVETNEVWHYLMQVPPPWAKSNRDLVALYKNATGGDCPLIIDKTTPSCGQSRFGCWVCTVVNKDKSMSALIDNGEEWMSPLLELRDLLADSRWDEALREGTRRSGKEGLGAYTPAFRAKVLTELLKAQKQIRETEPDLQLISVEELIAIQMQWDKDAISDYSVSQVMYETLGYRLKSDKSELEEELLDEVFGDKAPLIESLLKMQKNKSLLRNKRGLRSDISKTIDNFLRPK